jgi:glycosyltransferase involved in cell wall biosynthesis
MTIDETIRRILFRLNGRVLHFKPSGASRGNVLISYITLPYLNTSERALNAHTNRWESMEMVRAFTERGYAVDLIDITNTNFVPKKKYDFFVDNYHNMERLAPLLGPHCRKVFHATTAHWQFNNEAEQRRFDELFARRGVRLSPDRVMPANRAAQVCDEITLLGNEFTAQTYAYAGKNITKIPISTTHTFESPEHKDFEAVRKNFVWFGGAGVIHKGLDLVVEAFAQMPEYNLTICGKLDGETGFKEIYAKELALPNIKIAGFIDPGSEAFKKICSESVALIYPSCSEGQSGAVMLCMHAGLIPLISYESGVDVAEFGKIFKENSVEQIIAEVKALATSPSDTLQTRALAAWQNAREHYTRERFARAYDAFIDKFLISRK